MNHVLYGKIEKIAWQQVHKFSNQTSITELKYQGHPTK